MYENYNLIKKWLNIDKLFAELIYIYIYNPYLWYLSCNGVHEWNIDGKSEYDTFHINCSSILKLKSWTIHTDKSMKEWYVV